MKTKDTSLPFAMTIKAAVAYSSISRSKLYELIKSENIKTLLIKKDGCKRGKRLVARESLEQFLLSNET